MKSFSSTLTIAPFLKVISEPCLSDVCGDPYPFFSFLRGHSGLRLSVGRLFDGGGMLVEKTDRIFEKFSTSFSSSFSSVSHTFVDRLSPQILRLIIVSEQDRSLLFALKPLEDNKIISFNV